MLKENKSIVNFLLSSSYYNIFYSLLYHRVYIMMHNLNLGKIDENKRSFRLSCLRRSLLNIEKICLVNYLSLWPKGMDFIGSYLILIARKSAFIQAESRQ